MQEPIHADFSLSQITERVIEWSPPTARLQIPDQTLEAYFSPLANWRCDDTAPQQHDAFDLLRRSTARLYGDDVARTLRAQLERTPICETGAHVSFPRDCDAIDQGKTFYNDTTWQPTIISAALWRKAGLGIHLGLNTTAIPVSCGNGAQYIQLTPHFVTKVVSSQQAAGLLMRTPDVKDNIHKGTAISLQSIEAECRAFYFSRRINQATQLLEGATPLSPERRQSWLAFLRRPLPDTPKTLRVLEEIESDLKQCGLDVIDDSLHLERARQLIAKMKSPLAEGGQDFAFADQVLAVQSEVLNKILPPDIRQVTIDAHSFTRQLMIDALRNPRNVFYTIFADPDLRDRFIHELSGVRSGWGSLNGMVESPFLAIHTNKGIATPSKIDYQKHRSAHAPGELADNLERGIVIPTCALEVGFVPMATGIATHGGSLQSVCASEMQKKLAGFLDNMGRSSDAHRLRMTPMDINLQAAFFGLQEGQRPLRISDMMSHPLTHEEMDIIPRITTATAFALAVLSVHDFFTCCERHVAGNDAGRAVPPAAAEKIYGLLRDQGNIITRNGGFRTISAPQLLPEGG